MRARVAIRLPGRIIEIETVRLDDEQTLSATVELEDEVTEIDGLVVDHGARRAFAAGEDLELTTGQWTLMELLGRNPRRYVPHSELVEALGWPADSRTHTHSSQLKLVRNKLRERLEGEWIVNRKGFGYALRP